MPLPFHLIDGYNLLHAAGLARATYGPGDLERARFRLLSRIADGFDDTGRSRTTVVFDAMDAPPDVPRHFRFRALFVRFAAGTGDADVEIEELIRQHAAPRQLRVVSDDNRLQRAAKRRGAQAVKSDAFLRRLVHAVSPETKEVSAASQVMAHESEQTRIEDWLSYFGLEGNDLPIDAMTRRDSATSQSDQLSRSNPDRKADLSESHRRGRGRRTTIVTSAEGNQLT